MFKKLIDSLLSVGKMAIKSLYFPEKFIAEEQEVIVIGNGPSAKSLLINPPDFMYSKPLMAVNMMAGEECFTLLKPKYYLMADHAFFEFDEAAFKMAASHPRVKTNPGYEQTQKLVNNTWKRLLVADWNLVLFVPQIYMHTYPVLLARKQNIRIVAWNYTVVRGFEWFENWIYKRRLGSPQCQNVINACIFQSINAGFKSVYLTGIDNNFHLNIRVEQDNTVTVLDNHFYEVEKKASPLMTADKHGNPVKVQIHQFFGSLSKAFFSYQRLRRYADYCGVKIYNSTEGSFVDAFERKMPNSD